MRRFAQAGLLTLSGLGLLQASLLTDGYLRYVKEGMRPLLIVSGAVLVLLGAAEAWSALRAGTRAADGDGPAARVHDGHGQAGDGRGGHVHAPHGHDGGADDASGPAGEGDGEGAHGHDHSGVPRVAWLLFLPALSLLFYAPPALGSYTAAREAPKAVAVVDEDGFDPLPATSPLPITLTDFTQRVQQDAKRAIKGRTVRMTGFVTPAGDGREGWYLTRILLSCCAADAQSVKVRVYGVRAPKADAWVTVTGTWHAEGALGTPSAAVALDARGVEKVERPTNGYTDALPIGS
ncbi:TIGR03943 family putative permease subunit [Streptomyces sp. NPDC101166]|uniref:TIGR03943 family putative permease subunit n=1 Tax=Streptomyces sp. NPDC101166 TaxID=3366120 RepID=UPI003830FA30